MKKIFKLILVAASAAALMSSCYKQDDIYKEFVVVGGLTYPAKSINLTASPGLYRIVLSWDMPKDPSIRTAKVYWDNFSDSVAVNYADYADGHVSISIPNLEERSYTFDVVNFDEPGNKSLTAELTARPLGSSWLITHAERRVTSAIMDGDDAIINMSKSTDEMVYTKFMCRDTNGEWKEFPEYLKAGENQIRLHGVMKGKKIKYTSAYYEKNAADTIWFSTWSESTFGISYPLDPSKWEIKLTTGQERAGYGPELMFDGLTQDNKGRFFTTTATSDRNVFPKILTFDTNVAEGEEVTFTQFTFYLNPTSATSRYLRDVILYVGDNEYDKDDKSYATNFGKPAMNMSFDQSSDVQAQILNEHAKGRYFSLVFKNSRSTSGYIDVWELVPYGYIASQID